MRVTPFQKRAYFHSLPWLPIARGYHAGGPKAVNSPAHARLGRAIPRMVCTAPPTRLGISEDTLLVSWCSQIQGPLRRRGSRPIRCQRPFGCCLSPPESRRMSPTGSMIGPKGRFIPSRSSSMVRSVLAANAQNLRGVMSGSTCTAKA